MTSNGPVIVGSGTSSMEIELEYGSSYLTMRTAFMTEPPSIHRAPRGRGAPGLGPSGLHARTAFHPPRPPDSAGIRRPGHPSDALDRGPEPPDRPADAHQATTARGWWTPTRWASGGLRWMIEGVHPALARQSHALAISKAILAHHDPAAVLAYLASSRLRRYTAARITEASAFMEELRAIRATGRAFDREEFQQGFCRVAAPVFGAGGDVLGAIGVSVPARRFGGRSRRPVRRCEPRWVAPGAAWGAQPFAVARLLPRPDDAIRLPPGPLNSCIRPVRLSRRGRTRTACAS
ncbi:Pectin degradation repressor protein KdgR [bacterium HR12]|nr:Pectin degradation repressor protein KdgR [bacterium HR12]